MNNAKAPGDSMHAVTGFIRNLPYAGRIVLLAFVYFATARASLLLAIPPGYATAVWPPSGIAFAAIILFGQRAWPGIWFGAALINLTVETSLFAGLVIGTGNTLEALAGAALLRRWIPGAPPYFDRARNVVLFIAVALLCSTVAATTGVGALSFEGTVPWPAFASNWWTWWQGDVAGIIIVTPLLLTWSLRQSIAWTRAKRLEVVVFAVLLPFVSWAIFSNGFSYFTLPPLTFLILPFIIWAAFRFSQREVMTASTVICAVAVWHTVEGSGPFVLESLNQSLLLLLSFVSTVVATGLILSATVEERARTLEKLALVLHELKEQAATDPLTDLFNRRYLWDFLQREWIRARRRQGTLAVIMIDLDYFKRFNDRFGHEAGDYVLTEVATLLRHHIRGSDIACRFGGEEFALVLPDAVPDAVERRAGDIRKALGHLTLEHQGRKLGRVSASFGIAVFPVHAADPESLLRTADAALYQAKGAGRDRIVISPAREAAPA